ncbi:MAG: efflux RND transporter periplasmic adaptor subunit, partial [Vulcanimicrobiaceae bacterium]
MSRTARIAVLVVGLAVVIGLGVLVDRSRAHAIAVRTAKIAYGRFQTRLPETGQIESPHLAILAARVSGNLGTLRVKPGQHVETAELLATIDNPQVEENAATAAAAYEAARSRALRTMKTVPLQNAAAVVQARVALQQSEEDLTAGAQSGLGYGGETASEQMLAADAEVSRAQTALGEAQRVAEANKELYENKAISKDTLDQSLAKLSDAKVAADQTVQRRQMLGEQLSRSREYLRNRVRAQRDALRQAEANLAATRPDLAATQADVDKAAEELTFARTQLDALKIRAPFAGTVQNVATEATDPLRPLQPGDAITTGQALVRLAVDSPFIVRTRVDEQDVAGLAIGQRAVVSGETLGGKTLDGRVTTISAYAQKSDDPTNTSRQVVATVALDRSLPFLRDGMTVDVDIVTVDLPHALSVPSEAIRRDAGNKPYVFVVDNGLAKRVAVTLGTANDSSTVITKGLAAGDVVIADRNGAVAAGLA